MVAGCCWWCRDYYAPHYSYFSDYAEFYNIPQGLGELSEEDITHMESHYRFTTQRRKVRRVENLNSRGFPILTPHIPGHAECPVSMDIHYDADSGRVTEHVYCDAEGMPCVSTNGYARIARTFDARDNVTSISFYGEDGKAMEWRVWQAIAPL